MKRLQVAHLYKGGRFKGYGLAVDGELLPYQLHTTIETTSEQVPIMNVTFRVDKEMVNNPVTIDIEQIKNNKGEGGGKFLKPNR